MGKDEEMAESAVKDINNRWFDKRPIYGELSPVSDFREACCRQYELGECNRGGFCNFMHLKPISRELRKALYKRNKHKKREDRKYRDETAGGRHGGYAGGFGGWSGVGDGYDDRDYGYSGRTSTQHGSERKLKNMDRMGVKQEFSDHIDNGEDRDRNNRRDRDRDRGDRGSGRRRRRSRSRDRSRERNGGRDRRRRR